MQTEVFNVKKILFEDYDRYFKNLLDSPSVQVQRIIFYKRTADKFLITFSYDAFIIFTEITMVQIVEKYADDFPNTIEVVNDENDDHPAIAKFKAEYLSRGIPEVD